ncbi:uncharacterized protein EV420DRAFT_1278611 [Desarmillaria tabescens]|uniref:HNH nuclease domain-containing protein n=1 Tax=Armillaria tabescens TaxID=1929756 RepID=A0AA39JGW1_ARMTA|nr:uncharacterized protein EV420DRAFT_1278611 [Desarmillaria tabescens]KAK0441720.1 hypothetical protein EV420DRAFT_1278611 [Desarmillaria tabescens]
MATPEQRSVRLHVHLRNPDNAPASKFWLPCLEIPIDRLTELSSKPYRWLCYAGYCIMGVEGSLSFSPTDLGRVGFDYDAPFESTLTCGLYFHPGGPIFPIDPDFEEGSVTTLSEDQSSTFRTSIIERDGTCIVTNNPPPYCEAVHLIRQSKGSEYIERFTQRRGDGPGDIITDIDDPRNGLLVNRMLHVAFGHSVAILLTPNFIMKTTDVVPGAAPDEPRWTVQDFAEPTTRTANLRAWISAGQAVRTPPRGTQWPPHCLFAAVYASALITTWPMKEFLTQVRSMWMDTFYPKSSGRDQEKAERRKRKAERERENRHDRMLGDEVDVFDVLLMLREIGAYRDNMAGDSVPQPSSADESVQEKVLPWLQGIH